MLLVTAVRGRNGVIHERLSGYEEAPFALSTRAAARSARMVTDAGIEYQLSYADTVGTVSQAHIHFGAVGQSRRHQRVLVHQPRQRSCRHAGLPGAPAEVTGTIVAADVIGPAARASRRRSTRSCWPRSEAGTAYVNVHSSTYGGGEIRGQIETGHEGHH